MNVQRLLTAPLMASLIMAGAAATATTASARPASASLTAVSAASVRSPVSADCAADQRELADLQNELRSAATNQKAYIVSEIRTLEAEMRAIGCPNR